MEKINRDSEKLRKVSLCFIEQGEEILLAMKKRGFGAGLWNGYGGKQKPGESIEETAMRETNEEIGVRINKMEHVATINFFFDEEQKVCVYMIRDYSGKPVESEEMKPEWFDKKNIPYDKMWPDDKYWLPKVLEGKKLNATFVFGKGNIVKEADVKYV